MDTMGGGPIVSIIHTIIIGRMLKFSGVSNGHGINKVTESP